jgi:hypothetical protein
MDNHMYTIFLGSKHCMDAMRCVNIESVIQNDSLHGTVRVHPEKVQMPSQIISPRVNSLSHHILQSLQILV